jgi:cobalamin biosynthesis protein CobW
VTHKPGNRPAKHDHDAAGGVPRRGLTPARFGVAGCPVAPLDRRVQTPATEVDVQEALAKIPVTIITGFLGAGKTTLIRQVLENAGNRRLALIINEFGDVGVDGAILKSCGIDNCPEENIVELANGCLCCTVADDFIPAIEALLARSPRPDHIIIETSGLALPKPLVKAFEWPDIRTRLTVDGVIAVVDGAAVAEGRFADDPAKLAAQRAADGAIDHENPLEEVYENQLLCADLIVLNKTDLLSDDAARRVADEVRAVVPRAVKVLPVREGRVDPAILLGLAAAVEDDLEQRPSHHDAEDGHDHDDFDSFVVDVQPTADPAAFVARLTGIAQTHGVLRMKGFIEVTGKPMRMLVQGVGQRFRHQFDRTWAPGDARQGRLVVIGEKGIDKTAITASLAG